MHILVNLLTSLSLQIPVLGDGWYSNFSIIATSIDNLTFKFCCATLVWPFDVQLYAYTSNKLFFFVAMVMKYFNYLWNRFKVTKYQYILIGSGVPQGNYTSRFFPIINFCKYDLHRTQMAHSHINCVNNYLLLFLCIQLNSWRWWVGSILTQLNIFLSVLFINRIGLPRLHLIVGEKLQNFYYYLYCMLPYNWYGLVGDEMRVFDEP